MGSDRYHPKESPTHSVCINGFFIDPHLVTNCQFAAFVATIGYRMIAERSSNPADYPGRLPQMLKPDPLALRRTRGPVNLRDVSNWRGGNRV